MFSDTDMSDIGLLESRLDDVLSDDGRVPISIDSDTDTGILDNTHECCCEDSDHDEHQFPLLKAYEETKEDRCSMVFWIPVTIFVILLQATAALIFDSYQKPSRPMRKSADILAEKFSKDQLSSVKTQSQWIKHAIKKDDPSIRIGVFGDHNSGKTCIIDRYLWDTFNPNYEVSLGFKKGLGLVEGLHSLRKVVEGEEEYRMSGERIYDYECDAAIVVIRADHSLEEITKNMRLWKAYIRHKTHLPNGSPIPVMLFMNKWDLVTPSEDFETELDTLSKDEGFVDWFKVSAKTGENVNGGMFAILKSIAETRGWKITSEESIKKPEL